MTISGGSALPKEEIERMVKDAEQHAEEDKRRREETETRNTAEQLVYSTEKFLSDNGEKVPEETKTPVTTAVEDLKTALKPDSGASIDDIKAKMETLSTESQKMGSAMYAAQAEEGAGAEGATAGAAGGPNPGAEESSGEDVVDAEVVEDEDDKDAK